jgi:type III secretion system FlhB-like substrate exporter
MNQNATGIYEQSQISADTNQEELGRLANEILRYTASSNMLAGNPEIMAKLSALTSLQDSTEDLYPAISEIFAFLVSADSHANLKTQVQTNG